MAIWNDCGLRKSNTSKFSMKVNKICCILLLLFSGLESEYEKIRMYFATLDFSLILSFCSVIDEVADIFSLQLDIFHQNVRISSFTKITGYDFCRTPAVLFITEQLL